jgi:iron(III) transport system permease protein
VRLKIQRHGRVALAAGFVLAVFVVLPGLGFASRLLAPATNPMGLTPTQWLALRETALLMAGVAAVAASIGVALAWLVSVYDFPGRRWIDVAAVLPLAFPTYLAAYVAVDMLDFFGPVQSGYRWLTGARSARDYWFPDMRSLGGAIVILGLALMPYIFIPCRILFSRSGRNVIEAGRLLGAHGWRLFLRVGLPIAAPAMLAGVVLALLETLNDIGAVEYLGVSSLSAVIRDLWLNRFDLAGAARLAAIALAVVIILLLIDPDARMGVASRNAMRSASEPRRVRLSGPGGFLVSAFAALPLLVGFLLPSLHLISLAIRNPGNRAGFAELAESTAQTVFLGLSVSLVVVGAGALIAIAMRMLGGFRRIGTLTLIGYATPGTVLVLAMMPVLGSLDDAASRVVLPVLFTGSMLAVIYALSVRFLGLGVSQAALALNRLPLNVDAVARIHGLSDGQLAWRIHWPAIRPGLMMGALLVFIDTVKELPATLLLRPLNVETLATRAYSKASAGLFETGAIESLMIVLISALASMLLIRRPG